MESKQSLKKLVGDFGLTRRANRRNSSHCFLLFD